MLCSMTGFGQGEAKGEGKIVKVEIRTLNSRFLDIVVKLPRPYLALEERVRKEIKNRLARGRVDVFISISEENPENQPISVDKGRAIAYYSALKELAQILAIPEDITAYQILSLPDVLVINEPQWSEEALWPVVREALEKALEKLMSMRLSEGARLQQDLEERVQTLKRYVEAICQRAPLVPQEYALRLRERIAGLAGEGVYLDPGRLEAEVAFLAERCDIQEEITRLRSHLEELDQNLKERGPVGRRAEFILQEMFREINTLGAKASDLEISRWVIAFKTELEKIREQVQNVE
ncbi:MAG: YicC family protein [Thermanaeromonas sp.]|uniref:YicC/YloC family endoribonuclease n=1 Tax=Thermanaeromonas sp. TaxID=2003697 RepID=UPI002439BED2|nr:YicC/YloC family endoribonuclease [Thermanaeromonas sp.]MCG0276943.1 YicC family protein [Thermanaeromonas sp.]